MRHAAEWDRDSGVPEQFLALLRSEGYEYRAFGFSDDLSTLHADEFIGGFGGGNTTSRATGSEGFVYRAWTVDIWDEGRLYVCQRDQT